MKTLVLCFDRARRHPDPGAATNAQRLFHLVDEDDDQVRWYHPGVSLASPWRKLQWREAAADDARAAVAQAYQFLVQRWEPGDRIFMFAVGRGGYCAQTLTRLLGTVGVRRDLIDHVLTSYAVPRTERTRQDCERAQRVLSELTAQCQTPVPVWFLGLWDSVKIPGFSRRSRPAPIPNVTLGRHAVAIDGLLGERLVSSASDRVEEVWFRGTHRDVVGGPGASRPLAEITFDWMLDGAIRAGLAMPAERRHSARAGQFDAIAETTTNISMRTLPDHATVHSSVELYLRERPQYWKRLPKQVNWSDTSWAARSGRLTGRRGSTTAVKPSGVFATSL